MSLHACRTFHTYVFWMAGYPLAVIIYAVMKKEPGTFGLRQLLPVICPTVQNDKAGFPFAEECRPYFQPVKPKGLTGRSISELKL